MCSIIKIILCLSPSAGENDVITVHLAPRIAQFLPCTPDTNLPVSWRRSGIILHPGPRHRLLSQGLIIWPSSSDAGLYTCETVETVKGREHRKTVVQYLIEVQNLSAQVLSLQIAVIFLAWSAAFLICLVGIYFRAAKSKRVGSQTCNSCQERAFRQRDQVNQRCREKCPHHRVRDAGSEGAGASQAQESQT